MATEHFDPDNLLVPYRVEIDGLHTNNGHKDPPKNIVFTEEEYSAGPGILGGNNRRTKTEVGCLGLISVVVFAISAPIWRRFISTL